jgi:pantoate--beta-alanine ligase
MEVFYKASLLTEAVRAAKETGKWAGFVPTMGALHEGHLSLIRASKAGNDITIASIFVNPTQFNDPNDLKRYPRMPEKDMRMLESAGCNILFVPDEKEIYPEPDSRIFNFDGLDCVMEGKHRPGHFNGVAQVVTRLFDIAVPNRAYFGLKDFQQVAIIRKVVSDFHYPVEIIACPIVRECDGLAMSSRNMLLSSDERKKALVLSRTLFHAFKMKPEHSPAEIVAYVKNTVQSEPGVRFEYFEIVDGSTLQPVSRWNDNTDILGCIAACVGKIRLIDNINFSL